jgi:hypothetical protein
MVNLLANSLIDLGHEITDLSQAELVIVIQKPYRSLLPDKKYVLLQTEQPGREKHNGFKPNKTWGFGIDNAEEEYLPLGWHPCLEVSCESHYALDVGFIGAMTKRRTDFLDSVGNKFTQIRTFDYAEKIRLIKASRINLNNHSYYDTPQSYTEWDRISMIIANKAFLISERFFCPLPVIQYQDNLQYDQLVFYYLGREEERKSYSEYLYELYKKNHDMRDILTEKLKGL